MKARLVPLILVTLYFLVIHLTMGLRLEHILLVGFILVCFYLHPKSRQFALDFLPFVLFGALYDFLRIYPKGWAGPVHVVWPYRLEMALFGFSYQGTKILPTDFFLTHHHTVLDVIAAATYSLHVVVPIGFGFLLWFRDRGLARRFALAFLVANLMAFVTYVALPVAPPWYVELCGLAPADWSIPASAAGLIRFDQMIGTPYFEGIYARSAWTFGAVPSMHAGFPVLVILFAHKFFRFGTSPSPTPLPSREGVRGRGFLVFLYLFTMLVWFSAVYLRHHYVIDLIAGALYVVAAYTLTRKK